MRVLHTFAESNSRDAHPQVPAPTDPEWSGAVTVDGGLVVQLPRDAVRLAAARVQDAPSVRRTPDLLV